MSRTNVWLLLSGAVLGMLLLGLGQAMAWRDFRTEPRPPGAAVPGARYQVVTVNESEIILLDVITGDLYSAKPRDVKPYSSRPLPDGGPRFATEVKDRAVDKGKYEYKDKPDYKDIVKDKDGPYKDKDK